MKVSSKVPAAYDKALLVDYLAARFTYQSAEAWRRLVQEGKVSCNGQNCDGTTAVASGDVVTCMLPAFAAPKANYDYTIVYEDEWLLGIDKPAGLRVHSQGRFMTANLIYHIRHRHQPNYPEVNLVNRLDADTSGLVLLARTPDVLRRMMHQFAQGSVEKHYLTVVNGCPSPACGTIDLPIGPLPDTRVPRFGIDLVAGKPAVTHYALIRVLDDRFSLLHLRPETGRTHQLRVHLASIGHPIAGDALYTMNDDDYLAWRRNPPSRPGLLRQALHCRQLGFLHPVHNTWLTMAAPLAADIERFIGAEEQDSQHIP